MTAHVIDGTGLSVQLRARIRAKVADLKFQPGLAVVLVGDDPASAVYVRNKDRAAKQAGLSVQTFCLPAAASEASILELLRGLNSDRDVDGILVQLPLPRHVDPNIVIGTITSEKDVDGLTSHNVGLLAAAGRIPYLDHPNGTVLAPCTPRAVMLLPSSVFSTLRGERALVLGRSALVGRPVAAMLTAADATVTVAHSQTIDLPAECRRASIIVAAVGRPELIRADWLSAGSIVIDVGINRSATGKLVGDIAFEECLGVAGAITPVPGGVGPMTIACLIENTVAAAIARRGRLQ